MNRWALLVGALCGLCEAFQVALVPPYEGEISSAKQDTALSYCSGVRTGNAHDASVEVLFKSPSKGYAAVAIYRDHESEHLGRVVDGETRFICTGDLVASEVCTRGQEGSLLVSPDGYESENLHTFTLNLGLLGSMSMGAAVNSTGLYCASILMLPAPGGGESTTSELVLDFQNGFEGHLAASEWPKLPWHGWLVLLYVMATGAWFTICGMNRESLMGIHHVISVIGLLAVAEQAWAWGLYTALNAFDSTLAIAGRRTMWAMTAGARHTLTLAVVLLLAQGYGMTRERKCTILIIVLGLCHFIFTSIYNGFSMSNAPVSHFKEFLFVLPLSTTWGIYMHLIRVNLSSRIADLDLRRQSWRKRSYSRLLVLLLGFSGSYGILVGLDVLFYSHALPRPWRMRWVFDDAVPSTLDFVVLALTAYIFSPQQFNRLSLSSQQVPQTELEAQDFELRGQDDDEADAMPLHSIKGEHEPIFAIDDDE